MCGSFKAGTNFFETVFWKGLELDVKTNLNYRRACWQCKDAFEVVKKQEAAT